MKETRDGNTDDDHRTSQSYDIVVAQRDVSFFLRNFQWRDLSAYDGRVESERKTEIETRGRHQYDDVTGSKFLN